MKCDFCKDSGWVCQRHPERPWDGNHACRCGAPGAPCPSCNGTNDATAPRLPSEFTKQSIKKNGVISAPKWSFEFEDPIGPTDGRKPVTLRECHKPPGTMMLWKSPLPLAQEQIRPSDACVLMARATAYLISIGIIGFGFWIFAKAGQGSSFLWIAGLASIAVGLASIINEIRNDTAT